MSWNYEIVSGRLYDNDGEVIGVGYSGDAAHKNNPDDQMLIGEGPIPVGSYTINAPVDSPSHGPYALPLTPDPSNEMHGRSDFLMHGDSLSFPGTASKGCVIMARDVREAVWASGDRDLNVIVKLIDEETT